MRCGDSSVCLGTPWVEARRRLGAMGVSCKGLLHTWCPPALLSPVGEPGLQPKQPFVQPRAASQAAL